MSIFKALGRAIAAPFLPSPPKHRELDAAAPAPPALSGTDRIDAAISKFRTIADEISAGVADNQQRIDENIDRIAQLETENEVLKAANSRGRSVEAKLRDLIS